LTLPGSDRPVVRYRVLLHDRPARPGRSTRTPYDRSAESTDRPMRGVPGDMPITRRMSLLVLAVLVVYVTVMVAAFGIAAGALVVCLGVVVLIAARGRGLR
jgi:hypothetical protein